MHCRRDAICFRNFSNRRIHTRPKNPELVESDLFVFQKYRGERELSAFLAFFAFADADLQSTPSLTRDLTVYVNKYFDNYIK